MYHDARFTECEGKKVLYGDHVRLSVLDLVSATKQLGLFSLNLYGCNLQKLQAMCEFRENPLSDNHILFNDVGQLLPYFQQFVTDLWEIRYGRFQHNVV